MPELTKRFDELRSSISAWDDECIELFGESPDDSIVCYSENLFKKISSAVRVLDFYVYFSYNGIQAECDNFFITKNSLKSLLTIEVLKDRSIVLHASWWGGESSFNDFDFISFRAKSISDETLISFIKTLIKTDVFVDKQSMSDCLISLQIPKDDLIEYHNICII